MVEIKNMTDEMTKGERLFLFLKKEEGYYRAVLEITKEENFKLDNLDSIKNYQLLLKRKKIVITCVDEIERKIKELRKWWSKEENRKGEPWRERVEEELKILDDLVCQILDIDLKNQALFKRKLELLKEKALPTSKNRSC